MNKLDQFSRQQYLSIETFRKNGAGVRTPVWFGQEDETIYVITRAGSGKVKRIRNNGCINITPCKMDGTPLGTWSLANATEITDTEIVQKANRLLDKKYGLFKKLFGLGSDHRKGPADILLEIKLIE